MVGRLRRGTGSGCFCISRNTDWYCKGHAQAVAGMEKGGFVGISHNVDPMTPTSSQAPSPMSSGIIIAVRRTTWGTGSKSPEIRMGVRWLVTLLKDDGAAIRWWGYMAPLVPPPPPSTTMLGHTRRNRDWSSLSPAKKHSTTDGYFFAGSRVHKQLHFPDLDCWEGPDTARPACLALSVTGDEFCTTVSESSTHN